MSISSEPGLYFPGSKDVGRPVSSETILREALWPHIGQSVARTMAVAAASAARVKAETIVSRRNANFIFISSLTGTEAHPTTTVTGTTQRVPAHPTIIDSA